MSNAFALLAGLFLLAALYSLLGIVIPKLPLIKTRGRAVGLLGMFLLGVLVFAALGEWSQTPEEKQRMEEQRKVRQAERTERIEREQREAAVERAERAQRAEREQHQAAMEKAAKADREARKWADATVDIGTLLYTYNDNELSADSRFKGNPVQVTGLVGDIKKDILNKPYVTLGTGKEFEIPMVQCLLAKGQEEAAAKLHKGQQVTMRGTVQGLMMNVLVENCVVVGG